MPDTQLRERLAELHTELERAPEVDGESRRLLAALADDIRAVLDRAENDEDATLAGRLSEAVREFESSHPQLSAAIGRVADTLSNLGI